MQRYEDDLEEEQRQELEDVAVQLYGSLSRSMADHADIVLPMLREDATPCIWVGRGFVDAGLAVIESAVDFTPYVFRLPQAVLPFRSLMAMLKVRVFLLQLAGAGTHMLFQACPAIDCQEACASLCSTEQLVSMLAMATPHA